jgi:hypothetical protein
MIFLITLFLWLQDKKITALKICFKKTNRHACSDGCKKGKHNNLTTSVNQPAKNIEK